ASSAPPTSSATSPRSRPTTRGRADAGRKKRWRRRLRPGKLGAGSPGTFGPWGNAAMRLCRYQHNGNVEVALYLDDRLASVNRLAAELGVKLPTPMSGDLLDYLPPDGKSAAAARQLAERFARMAEADRERLTLPLNGVKLRGPGPEPKKISLLAGNYADHIKEGGGQAAERQETFPYFFWKPPSTTLTHPGDAIRIPAVSPDHVDWEVELGVVIGRRCKGVGEKEALG